MPGRTDLSRRASEPEMMDDLACAGEVVDQTLRELEFINRWLGGNSVTLSAVIPFMRSVAPGECLRILDLGCGGGDMLLLIADAARRRGVTAELTGLDANPAIVAYARANTRHRENISVMEMDVFSRAFEHLRADVAIATLFFHHFGHEQLVTIFRRLHKQVRSGFVINDIHRHAIAYYSIMALTRLFSRSPMVRFDAPLSVRRAFRKSELVAILKEAGIRKYSIRWKWAFRWQVVVYA